MKETDIITRVSKQLEGIGEFRLAHWADYRVRLHIPLTSIMEDAQSIAQRFVDEYNTLNNTIYGNAANLFGSEYLKGQMNSGCVIHRIPQSDDYQRLREKVLDIKEQVFKRGFNVELIQCKQFWLPESSCQWELALLLDNKELSAYRDGQYHLHQADALREQEEEKRAERAYEEKLIGRSWS